MKKLLTLGLLSFILFFGCNQETKITSPVNTGLNKELTLIPLPLPSSGLNLETDYTETMEINGNYGGVFSADFSYQGGTFGTVSQYSTLDFDAGAFSGVKNISQTFSSTGAAIVFEPAMQFYNDVEYSYKITGVDLSGVNPNTLDFVYIDSNGNMFSCEYEYITMDVITGTLEVVNVELNHFSRYGFVN